MKKPLKSILASLATPAPSIQVIEEAEDETAAKVVESDEEFGLTSAPAARRSDWDAKDDTRYEGKTTSRRKLADSEDEEEDGEEEDGSDGEEDEALEASEDEEDFEEKTEEAVSKTLEARYDIVSDEDSEGSDEEESGDEEMEDGEGEDDGEDDDEEPDEISAKSRKPAKNVRFSDEEVGFQDMDGEDDEESDEDGDDFDDGEDHFGAAEDEDSAEQGTNVFSQTRSQSSEVEKGLAVKHQLEEWDAFLQWRIHLQKLLHSSNQVPDWRTYSDFTEAGDKDFSQSLTKAKHSVKQLLVAIINARETRDSSSTTEKKKRDSFRDGNDEEIPSDDEEIPSSEASGEEDSEDDSRTPSSKKFEANDKNSRQPLARANQSLEQLEEIRRSSFAKAKAYRESVIQEWSDKTRLMSRTSKDDKGFAAFDQSTLQQIRHIMADRQRLLKRTRSQRSTYQILGKRKAPPSDFLPPAGGADGEDGNPEIFDDDDFYQNLLREFIEKRVSTDGNANLVGQHWLEMQNLRKKLKKQRLDRESKDRRIKYEVHQKMVSFMAPKLPPMDALNDEARNELFSCLFGKNSVRDSALHAENGVAGEE